MQSLKLMRAVAALLLILLVSPPVASADDATAAEVARVRYELSKVEQKVKDADGMGFELSKYDRRAFRLVKELADKFPQGARVKQLVAEAKKLYRAAKGVGYEITPDMLAYRKRGSELRTAVAKEAQSAWEALRLGVIGDLDYLDQPFPTKQPPEVTTEEMLGRKVIFSGVPYERALFLQSGAKWLSVGDPTKGYYWIQAGERSFNVLFEALRRYQSQVQQVVPEKWTFVGEIVGADVLSPDGGKKGGGDTYSGWVVKPTAIYISKTVLLVPDAGRDDGARYTGEDKLKSLISYSVNSVPADVTPRQLVEIYIVALKEKNWDLHLECIDPEQRKHGPQLDHFRYTWEIQQKGIERFHAHAAPASVDDIVVTRGFVDENLESFFGDEEAQPKGPQEKEERVHVAVRLYDEHGRQTARQRHVTLIRRNGGRWYIYSGGTLMF